MRRNHRPSAGGAVAPGVFFAVADPVVARAPERATWRCCCIAYERFSSPWAIGIVLIADLVPPMMLGPVFGAVADRWSRRTCAVVADVVRAVAFVGMVLVDGFVPTVAFALLAGVGTALFTPATLASLPSLVGKRAAARGHLALRRDRRLRLHRRTRAGGRWCCVAGGSGGRAARRTRATFAISALVLLTARLRRRAGPSRDAGEDGCRCSPTPGRDCGPRAGCPGCARCSWPRPRRSSSAAS